MFAANVMDVFGGTKQQLVGNQDAVGDAPVSFEHVLSGAGVANASEDPDHSLLTETIGNLVHVNTQDVELPTDDAASSHDQSGETIGLVASESYPTITGRSASDLSSDLAALSSQDPAEPVSHDQSGETIGLVASESHPTITGRFASDLTSDPAAPSSQDPAEPVLPKFLVGSPARFQANGMQRANQQASLINPESKSELPVNEQTNPHEAESQNATGDLQLDVDARQAVFAAPQRARVDRTIAEGEPDESVLPFKSEQPPSRQSVSALRRYDESNDSAVAATETKTALRDDSGLSHTRPSIRREAAHDLPADFDTINRVFHDPNQTTSDRVAQASYRAEVASGQSIEINANDSTSNVDARSGHEAPLSYRLAESAGGSLGISATDLTAHGESAAIESLPVADPRRETTSQLVEVNSKELADNSTQPTLDQVVSVSQQPDRSDNDAPVLVGTSADVFDGDPRQAALWKETSSSRPLEFEDKETLEADGLETTESVEPLIQESTSDSTDGYDTSSQDSRHPLFQQNVSGTENDPPATRDQPISSAASPAASENATQGAAPVSTNVTTETAPAIAAVTGRDSILNSRPMGVAEQVVSAVTQVMETSDGSTINTVELELHPAELGRLKIQVEQTAESIAAHIIASELVSSDLLASKKDALLEALSDLGLGEASVDISFQENEQSDSQPDSQRGGLRNIATTNASESSDEAVNVSTSTGLNIVV